MIEKLGVWLNSEGWKEDPGESEDECTSKRRWIRCDQVQEQRLALEQSWDTPFSAFAWEAEHPKKMFSGADETNVKVKLSQ